MRRFLIIAGLVIGLFLALRFCTFKEKEDTIEYNTNLIQQQIVNVGKLIVTEGHFAEVLTYKDQETYLRMFSFDKKALIIVNADVTVAYDLRQMKYDIDESSKTISILYIPEAEIKISPDIKFYNIEQSRLNPFTGEDYNKVNRAVKENLKKKIDKSTLKSNAQNRLVSELSKILILTNTMGWKLEYDGKTVNEQTIDQVIPKT